MNKVILISVIFFTALSNHSQPIFEKIFDYSQVNGVFDMILTSDSSLLIYGSLGNPGSPVDYVLLIKTDLEGEIIWHKNFLWEQTYSKGKQIIESSTGFYYFTGSYFHKPFLVKLNKDGDTIWSKKWSADPEHPRNITTIKQMSVNKFVLSGEVSNSLYGAPPNQFMKITDTLANEICSGGGPDGTIYQTRIKENNYFVLGMNWYEYEIVINKNINCSIEDQLYSEMITEPSDFDIDNQNYIYYTSSMYNVLTKIDSAGTVLWTNSLIPNEEVYPKSILIDNDKIITTGSIQPIYSNSWFFISICDTSGSTDTVYIDQSYYAQGGKKIIKVGDDLYVTGILRVEEPPAWHPVIFLRKYSFDSLTTSISTFNSKERNPINVFPNPVNDKIIFEYSGSSSFVIASGSKILITNSYGQPITQIPITGNKTIFDCRRLPSGIYFYQFQTTEKTYTGKFMIIK